MTRSARLLLPVALVALSGLAGCDLLGIEGASAVAARKEAEGKAIGAACRHAGRAIEDCYTLNRRADKAAVFAGWREMNDYMVENKIDAVRPELGPDATVADAQATDDEAHDGTKADKPAGGEKGAKAPASAKDGAKASGRHGG